MGLFDALDATCAQGEMREKIIRAPFGYPGGKTRSLKYILPHLPMKACYVEVFGGSGAVLLNRHPSKLEVFNDRYSGVTSFYKCMRDPVLYDKLCAWLDNTLHSREEFVFNRDTWESCSDPIERAGRWFAMVNYSFASLGRNWGRSTTPGVQFAGRVRNKIKDLPEIHARFKGVQVENASWENILKDYDSRDTVFYLDPPYVDSYSGTYQYEMSIDDHKRLIDTVFSLKGFVAVSGYHNPLYANQKWDKHFDWKVQSTMATQSVNSNIGVKDRGDVEECLWIKE